MSNLLKNKTDSGITLFGFPAIRDESADIDANVHETEAIDDEQTYRTKLLELERRTQEIEKDAYAKGFAQGEKDGLEYGHKTVQVIKSQLERIVGSMETLPERVFQDYRHWFITTCLAVARRVVQKELAISPEIIAGTLNALLDEAEEHSSLTIYLNPSDVEFMEKRADLIFNSRGKHFAIKPDGSLARGGCRIESEVQLLDASIDTQFEVLQGRLLGGNILGGAVEIVPDEE